MFQCDVTSIKWSSFNCFFPTFLKTAYQREFRAAFESWNSTGITLPQETAFVGVGNNTGAEGGKLSMPQNLVINGISVRLTHITWANATVGTTLAPYLLKSQQLRLLKSALSCIPKELTYFLRQFKIRDHLVNFVNNLIVQFWSINVIFYTYSILRVSPVRLKIIHHLIIETTCLQ